jgi:hypothetical protein
MFQRQAYGSVNPFQSWPGVNPFFQQVAGASPFYQQPVGAHPLWQLFGGINPLQQIAGQINPLQQFAGQLPFSPVTGMNPLLSQMTGAQPLGLGPGFGIPALGANPLGIPSAPFGIQSGPFGQPAFGQPPFGQPAFGQPAFGQSPFGQPAFGHQGGYGAGPVNPYLGPIGGINPLQVDPTAALMIAQHIAQQQNPASQYFPIRPLLGQNPLEQIQGISAGPIPGQVADPYAALIHAQIVSQLATHPLIHHLVRAQLGAQ